LEETKIIYTPEKYNEIYRLLNQLRIASGVDNANTLVRISQLLSSGELVKNYLKEADGEQNDS